MRKPVTLKEIRLLYTGAWKVQRGYTIMNFFRHIENPLNGPGEWANRFVTWCNTAGQFDEYYWPEFTKGSWRTFRFRALKLRDELKTAKTVQQSCDDDATVMRRSCNDDATVMQRWCNGDVTPLGVNANGSAGLAESSNRKEEKRKEKKKSGVMPSYLESNSVSELDVVADATTCVASLACANSAAPTISENTKDLIRSLMD